MSICWPKATLFEASAVATSAARPPPLRFQSEIIRALPSAASAASTVVPPCQQSQFMGTLPPLSTPPIDLCPI
jgi:hypothetical protein